MEIQRLVVEESQNALTLDFDAGLTVAFHENPVVRSRCLADLLDALGPARPGVHLELIDHQHRHLAVFRPRNGRHRVIDIDQAADVTAEFGRPGGPVDLLGRLGLDAATAGRLLRVGARQIDRGSDTGTDNHRHARRLATLDQAQLWQSAAALQQAEAALQAARADLPGRDVEQASEFDRIAAAHDEAEATVASHRSTQRFGLILASACEFVGVLLLAFEKQIGDSGFTGKILVALGLAAAAVTALDRHTVQRLRRQERTTLQQVGVPGDFDELASQVGPLAQPWRRQALIDATAAHQQAEEAWRLLTSGIELSWALQHRAAIEAMASQKGHLRRIGAEHLAAEETGVSDSARVLVDKIIELQEVGVTREQLPLLLDEPFVGYAPIDVERLLSTVHRLAGHHQIILVTGDPYIQAWATQSAAAASVRFVRIGRTPQDAEPSAPAGGATPTGVEPEGGSQRPRRVERPEHLDRTGRVERSTGTVGHVTAASQPAT